jgi:hypothetical protein
MPDAYALDSRAVLGLLAKANQMFTSADTTLSFPLGAPLAYNAEQLTAAMGTGLDADGLALLAEFSTAMNLLPGGVVWPASTTAGLDDIVRTIVNEAEWALAERTPEEEARFTAAQLQVNLQNPEMATYASLKDAWIRTREQLAKDPANESAQEAEQAAQLALLAHPARERIEQAMQDLIALDERAPHRTRDRFDRNINPGAGTFESPNGGRFSPVRLVPRAVVTSPGWDAVTLDRAALDELSATAPAVLTDRLQLTNGDDDKIVQISFEYASALLQRTWFEDEMFRVRCWRFEDSERLISDGKVPPAGECPSYTCAVVLARNISVTSTRPPDSGGGNGGSIRDALRFLIPQITDVQKTLIVPPVEPAPVDPPIEPDPPDRRVWLGDREVHVRAGADLSRLTRRVEPVAEPEPGALRRIVQPADRFTFAAGGDRAAPAGEQLIRADFSRKTLVEDSSRAATLLPFLRNEALLAPDFFLIEPDRITPKPPPPAAPDTVTVSTPAGTVIVLALICKSVPLTPDPDPNCRWA